MITFEYKGFRVTLTNVTFASGDQEWGFSILSGEETVRHRAPAEDPARSGRAATGGLSGACRGH